MNETDLATEQALRLAAREDQPGAKDILADFYEAHGQASRAALWRNPDRDARTEGERDRTCIKKIANPGPIDPRRDAMIWILCLTGLPLAAIGSAFKISRERVREIAARIDRKIYYAARTERVQLDHVARRLRVAGAILTRPTTDNNNDNDDYFDYFTRQARLDRARRESSLLTVEIPPETWPYTRAHEKQRAKTKP